MHLRENKIFVDLSVGHKGFKVASSLRALEIEHDASVRVSDGVFRLVPQ